MADHPVISAVAAQYVATFGPDTGRASVTFLGTEPYDVLRFGPDAGGVVRYATLGMSRQPLTDPTAEVAPVSGPRGELVLSVRGAHDSVARRLAVLAAAPAVEGVRMVVGASLDLSEPLWDGARFTAVLVGAPDGLVPDVTLPDGDVVHVFPLLPMTPNEAAWKRVHGAGALEERWLRAGVDLRDPARPEAPLGG